MGEPPSPAGGPDAAAARAILYALTSGALRAAGEAADARAWAPPLPLAAAPSASPPS
jgi:hypothetical protein